jgi:hypothetical protein
MYSLLKTATPNGILWIEKSESDEYSTNDFIILEFSLDFI